MTTVLTERPSEIPGLLVLILFSLKTTSTHVLDLNAAKLTLFSRELTSYFPPLGPLCAQSTRFVNSSIWTHVQKMHPFLLVLQTYITSSVEALLSRPLITVPLRQISKLSDVGPLKPLRLILKPFTRSATASAFGF
jgi:hypothetical protein